MTAKISQLWSTNRKYITLDGSELTYPQSFDELNKLDNVIVGNNISHTKLRAVHLDNKLLLVEEITVRNPSGSLMNILEVI